MPTQAVLRTATFAAGLVLAASPVVFASAQQTVSSQAPVDRLDELREATSLVRPSLHPWHLRMSFQLYDLKGKPKETGTIEEWWVAPGKYRRVVDSPSYHRETPSTDTQPTGDDRTGYLVDFLLKQITNPVPVYKTTDRLTVKDTTRDFGKVKLPCMMIGINNKPAPSSPTFCSEPGKPILRAVFDNNDMALIRNRLGTYQQTHVALEDGVMLGPFIAISGSVDKLEDYDPATNPIKTTESDAERTKIPQLVLSGKIVKKVTPVYPMDAKNNRIAGTVLLHAIIGKDGHIQNLTVISSPYPSLAASATDAVKGWVYSPYLLDGNPTEVDTTITVHYNIGN
jgi:TonB family protein